MIEEVALVGVVGGTALAIADKFNVFGWNPEGRWFWERVAWPWVAQTPAVGARLQAQAIPRLSGEARIKNAQAVMGEAQREIVRGVTQQAEEARQVSYGLGKYTVTAQSGQQYIQPYRQKIYP